MEANVTRYNVLAFLHELHHIRSQRKHLFHVNTWTKIDCMTVLMIIYHEKVKQYNLDRYSQ